MDRVATLVDLPGSRSGFPFFPLFLVFASCASSYTGIALIMYPTWPLLPSLISYLAVAAAELNLLTFADGGRGQLLGSTFGLPGTNATFDYVVVGGGTAGLTIATRLASNPAVSVAVIEAGGFYEIDNGNRSIVPGYSSFYTGADPTNYQPLVDWGFVTEPQPVPTR